jgi:hypothetical protein
MLQPGWGWGEMSAVLSEFATLSAALAAVWASIIVLRRLWRATVGSRNNQRRIIDRLFPGAHLRYLENLLGPPTLIGRRDATGSVRRYRLLDCWISAGYKHGASEWISITVTDAKFVPRTDRFTRGLIDVRLGRDSFVTATKWWPVGTGEGSIGQKEQLYVESNPGPTAHRSQKAMLGYTNLGVGTLGHEGDIHSPKFLRDRTTVNSIAVSKPFGELPTHAFLSWQEAQIVPLGRRRRVQEVKSAMRVRFLLARARRTQRHESDH